MLEITKRNDGTDTEDQVLKIGVGFGQGNTRPVNGLSSECGFREEVIGDSVFNLQVELRELIESRQAREEGPEAF